MHLALTNTCRCHARLRGDGSPVRCASLRPSRLLLAGFAIIPPTLLLKLAEPPFALKRSGPGAHATVVLAAPAAPNTGCLARSTLASLCLAAWSNPPTPVFSNPRVTLLAHDILHWPRRSASSQIRIHGISHRSLDAHCLKRRSHAGLLFSIPRSPARGV
jgi:hypothetical protein